MDAKPQQSLEVLDKKRDGEIASLFGTRQSPPPLSNVHRGDIQQYLQNPTRLFHGSQPFAYNPSLMFLQKTNALPYPVTQAGFEARERQQQQSLPSSAKNEFEVIHVTLPSSAKKKKKDRLKKVKMFSSSILQQNKKK